MKTDQTQFDKASQAFSRQVLSDEKKQAMLSQIYASVPVPDTLIPSPFSFDLMFLRHHAVAAVAVFLLVVTGGTSYAAMQSLPGDALYAAKTNWIEPVGLALRQSEEAKNRYKISLLQERVKELNQLQEQGKATPTTVLVNFESANRIVHDLEESAIFDEEGHNSEVSATIESYNSATGDFGIKIDSNITGSGTSSTSSVNIKIESDLEEVTKDVDDTVKEVNDTVEVVEETVDTVIDIIDPEPIVETITEPVEGVVKKLGL